jgi:3-phosphoglycerate kinase
MNRITVRDVGLEGARAQTRGDADGPTADGIVTDDRRIGVVLPAIREVLDQAAASKPIEHHDFGHAAGGRGRCVTGGWS